MTCGALRGTVRLNQEQSMQFIEGETYEFIDHEGTIRRGVASIDLHAPPGWEVRLTEPDVSNGTWWFHLDGTRLVHLRQFPVVRHVPKLQLEAGATYEFKDTAGNTHEGVAVLRGLGKTPYPFEIATASAVVFFATDGTLASHPGWKGPYVTRLVKPAAKPEPLQLEAGVKYKVKDPHTGKWYEGVATYRDKNREPSYLADHTFVIALEGFGTFYFRPDGTNASQLCVTRLVKPAPLQLVEGATYEVVTPDGVRSEMTARLRTDAVSKYMPGHTFELNNNRWRVGGAWYFRPDGTRLDQDTCGTRITRLVKPAPAPQAIAPAGVDPLVAGARYRFTIDGKDLQGAAEKLPERLSGMVAGHTMMLKTDIGGLCYWFRPDGTREVCGSVGQVTCLLAPAPVHDPSGLNAPAWCNMPDPKPTPAHTITPPGPRPALSAVFDNGYTVRCTDTEPFNMMALYCLLLRHKRHHDEVPRAHLYTSFTGNLMYLGSAVLGPERVTLRLDPMFSQQYGPGAQRFRGSVHVCVCDTGRGAVRESL